MKTICFLLLFTFLRIYIEVNGVGGIGYFDNLRLRDVTP